MNEKSIGDYVQVILPIVLTFAVLVMGVMVLVEMEIPRLAKKKKKLRAK
ncbi:MAG: hypothetical protein IPH28_19270 [Cytophagaceae bacterium]|mgnify:CR=1 FL=1|nr:hypothetical protein [Cytophagaceae bacterium]MBK9510995.1 hypothetical protein [Cytophagaceae bacterium]MBK9934431.1 hypothetical protein [Cytophagaceae bacterium]MBL0300878.1 hypothetical protein [Cytophagaceae bacterium]MBL0323689.1 hypothetical protein [Cytophagaceae bacterium]